MDSCNARMIDMPYALMNPEAKKESTSRFLRTFQGSRGISIGPVPPPADAPLALTTWGLAVHGKSGTWAFDSGGPHAADYVYELPQGGGAPSDFYLCDSRLDPQVCALLGGNLKHACAEYYDPRTCDMCEDHGDTLQCAVRGWNVKYS